MLRQKIRINVARRKDLDDTGFVQGDAVYFPNRTSMMTGESIGNVFYFVEAL